MTEPGRWLLNEAESRDIFVEKIVPREFVRGRPGQPTPVAVFVIAQHGSGKTDTSQAIKTVLDQRGGAVVIDNDLYKPYHPAYKPLMKVDGELATAAVALDGQRWGRMASDYLREHRVDVMIEETVQNPPYFREQVHAWRGAGYRVEVALLAVPEPVSRLGVLDRYQSQVNAKGSGRLPSTDKQRLAFAGVAEVAAMVEAEGLVDVVSVWRRGNVNLYFNRLDDGVWDRTPGAVQVLGDERGRLRTVAETTDFLRTHARLVQTMGPRFHGQLDDVLAQVRPLLARLTPGQMVAAAHQRPLQVAAAQSAAGIRPAGVDSSHRHQSSPHAER